MLNFLKQLNAQIAIFLLLIAVGFLAFHDWSSAEEKRTRALVTEWAEKLDQRVTNAGSYVKWEGDALPVNDGWGSPLRVTYKNEGVAEQLFVRSLGKDKLLGTDDDIVVKRTQVNLKGVGEGVKSNAEAVATSAAKGVVRGIKESIKERPDKPKP